MAGDVHRNGSETATDADSSASSVPSPLPKKPTSKVSLALLQLSKNPNKKDKKKSVPEETQVDIETPKTNDSSSSSSNNNKTGAKVVTVTDLSRYYGDTLVEQIDSFIESHPVVMFNRTWCLFSVDAVAFLVNELHVTVHSVDVDTIPAGKDILTYISEKTGHKTTPAIFIRGEFLGGFEQVNRLYATGSLQKDYLHGLSQADECDEFLTKSNIGKKPMFWFPETVNAYTIRVAGIMTCLTSLAAAVLVYWFPWGEYIAYGLAVDFFLRILGGTCLSPFGRIACVIGTCIGQKPRVGRPKQFASCCGLLFALLGSIFYILPFSICTVIGSVFMGMLAIATGMEGFLDFCVGCVIFRWGVQIGAIST
jgi:glutaredoxin-related protein